MLKCILMKCLAVQRDAGAYLKHQKAIAFMVKTLCLATAQIHFFLDNYVAL